MPPTVTREVTDPLLENADVLPTAESATILVIDDDLAMRTLLGLTLEGMGYLVLVAADGEAALEIAREHPEIRLLLLDVVMTGLSGKELVEQLQASLRDCSVLFISGHPASVMATHGIDLGVNHFLQKPCSPVQLQQKIDELLVAR